MRAAGILCILAAMTILFVTLGVYVSWDAVLGVAIILAIIGLVVIGSDLIMAADDRDMRRRLSEEPQRIWFTEEY